MTLKKELVENQCPVKPADLKRWNVGISCSCVTRSKVLLLPQAVKITETLS